VIYTNQNREGKALTHLPQWILLVPYRHISKFKRFFKPENINPRKFDHWCFYSHSYKQKGSY